MIQRLKKCVMKQLIDVFLVFIYILDQYKAQEMCNRVIF